MDFSLTITSRQFLVYEMASVPYEYLFAQVCAYWFVARSDSMR
jgi:hypothetical protein